MNWTYNLARSVLVRIMRYILRFFCCCAYFGPHLLRKVGTRFRVYASGACERPRRHQLKSTIQFERHATFFFYGFAMLVWSRDRENSTHYCHNKERIFSIATIYRYESEILCQWAFLEIIFSANGAGVRIILRLTKYD